MCHPLDCRERVSRGQRGSALLLVVVFVALLSGLSGALALQVLTEWRMAANHARADATSHAAESGVALVVDELSRLPGWSAALSGSADSAYGGGPLVVPLPTGEPVDLTAVGAALQGRTDARTVGADRPRWRLWAWGHLAALVPIDAPGPWPVVAVWVADDEADGDGDPLADTNDTLQVQAVALGPGPERAWAGALVRRTGGTEVEVLAWYQEP
jgi:hypothetical protein